MPSHASDGMQTLRNLEGRWSGGGWVETETGLREKLKCVATYFVKDQGGGLEQNLRCASTSYKIDAKGKLFVSGNTIAGTWVEQTYASEGAIAGQIRTGGFNVTITGPQFSAHMSIAAGPGKQQLNILPTGLVVKKISVDMVRS
jgi:hypothetical protein